MLVLLALACALAVAAVVAVAVAVVLEVAVAVLSEVAVAVVVEVAVMVAVTVTMVGGCSDSGSSGGSGSGSSGSSGNVSGHVNGSINDSNSIAHGVMFYGGATHGSAKKRRGCSFFRIERALSCLLAQHCCSCPVTVLGSISNRGRHFTFDFSRLGLSGAWKLLIASIRCLAPPVVSVRAPNQSTNESTCPTGLN